MKPTKVQRVILYTLGKFYESLNQPLIKKPITLQTSKIAFIELLLNNSILGKQRRALYKNLEALERKELIEYENKMIKFTEEGLNHLERIKKELKPYFHVEVAFHNVEKPNRKLQTVIKDF